MPAITNAATKTIEKGGIASALVVAAIIVSQAIPPAIEKQTAEITEVFKAENERTTESIERLSDSSDRSIGELTNAVKSLGSSLKAVSERVVGIDERVKFIRDNEIPRLDRRVDKLEDQDRE